MRKLSVVGLVVLGVIAVLLSGAAMLRFRGGGPDAAVPPTSAVNPRSPSHVPSGGEQSTESPTPPGTVVVIGDSHSVGDPSANWIGSASEGLGWGAVTNLSSPGRGYMKSPRSCDLSVCDDFEGSIGLIAELAPDLVVTFGGTADGDRDLQEAAAAYYTALRAALPDAQLVAINPLTGDDTEPYWLVLHRQNIAAAVEGVGGTLVNVGQPGLGDGQPLSPETQAMIAQSVIEQLSE